MLRSPLTIALLCTLAPAALAQAVSQPAGRTANPPANICLELTAWIDQSAAKAGAPAAAPAGRQSAPQPGGAEAAAPSANTAVEQPRSAGQQSPGGQDTAQKSSGLSGAVPQDGPGAAGPQGGAQEGSKSGSVNPKAGDAQQSAQAAKPEPAKPDSAKPDPAKPVPAKPAEAKAPSPSPQSIEKARQSAGANDLGGCAQAVRDMRLAGVAVPAPILALAALKPELRSMAPKGPAPGVPPIPPSGMPAVQGEGPGAAEPPAATPNR